MPASRRKGCERADFLMSACNVVKGFSVLCFPRYDYQQEEKNRTLAKMQPSETVRYTLINIPSWLNCWWGRKAGQENASSSSTCSSLINEFDKLKGLPLVPVTWLLFSSFFLSFFF